MEKSKMTGLEILRELAREMPNDVLGFEEEK